MLISEHLRYDRPTGWYLGKVAGWSEGKESRRERRGTEGEGEGGL
jgi:hypothetical protein